MLHSVHCTVLSYRQGKSDDDDDDDDDGGDGGDGDGFLLIGDLQPDKEAGQLSPIAQAHSGRHLVCTRRQELHWNHWVFFKVQT